MAPEAAGEQMAFVVKPDRMAARAYPDEALLERLSSTRLEEANIPEHEILQFRRLQSLTYGLRLAGYDLEAFQTEAFIGAAMFSPIQCKVVITRCEHDFDINEGVIQRLGARLPETLIWLTTNCSIRHPRIQALPLGITDYCGYTPFHAVIGDSARLKSLIDGSPRTEERLVLLNFFDGSNSVVRPRVRALFADKPFTTSALFTDDDAGYARYIAGLRSHPFCLAPAGNGIDTHRVWESLYAGSIPIVERSTAMEPFSDLPMLMINRWEDALDESLLRRTRDAYQARTWDLRKLTVSYWWKTIGNLVGAW